MTVAGRARPHPPSPPGALPAVLSRPLVLRPLTTADVLDGGFRLLRLAPAAVLVPALVVATASALLSAGLRLALLPGVPVGFHLAGSLGGADVTAALVAAAARGVIGTVAGGVVAAFLAGVAVQALGGRSTALSAVWPVVRGRLAVVVAAELVVGVAQTVALAFCLAPGVWLWTVWALAAPAVVVERASAGRALRRSFRVVRGGFWTVLGQRSLGWLVGLVAGFLFTVPFTLLAGVVDPPAAGLAIDTVGQLLAAAVVLPIRAGVDVSLYLDRRVRREAFDVVVGLAESAPVGPA